jgi:hypothetical protein
MSSMDLPEEIRPCWYLVFTEAKYDHWVWRFVDQGMGHVYAVQDLNDYQWLVIQPRVNITQAKILLKCDYPVINALADINDKIVRVECEISAKPRGCLNWFTCVEQVKALVGIRSFWTLTPKQLYKGLIGGRYGKGK